MMKFILTICLIINAFALVFAQTSTSSSAIEAEQRRELQERRRIEEQRRAKEFERLKNITNPTAKVYPTRNNGLYSHPQATNKEQKKLLRPNPEDSAKYAAFLKNPHTGLIKLSPDFNCLEKNLIHVDGPCATFIPLGGFYSFRQTEYSYKGLADIGINNDKLFSPTFFANRIMVLLGDVPIETVSLDSNGVKFLSDYHPALENKQILAKSQQLKEGIENGDYRYIDTTEVRQNTTYVLRVIAYRGEILIRSPYSGRSHNILSGDKRVDTIVVFRLLNQGEGGTFTVIWKELQRKDSPKIELSKEEQERYLLGK
jgi:hypothetical protein